MNYLYHRVPPIMVGTHIVPLSELAQIDPVLFEKEQVKYKGREAITREIIYPLNCLWNEVIFLTPVHPMDVEAALASVGETMGWRRFYKIDASTLDPSNTTLWLHDGDKKTPESFLPFSPDEMGNYSTVPPRTLRYYWLYRSRGQRPLVFAGMPHVLFKGRIDIRAVEIITI